MLVIEFAYLKITGAAERNGANMAKQLPLPLRRLDRDRRTCTINGFTFNKTLVDEIEGQCHKVRDFGHQCPLCNRCLAYNMYSRQSRPLHWGWRIA